MDFEKPVLESGFDDKNLGEGSNQKNNEKLIQLREEINNLVSALEESRKEFDDLNKRAETEVQVGYRTGGVAGERAWELRRRAGSAHEKIGQLLRNIKEKEEQISLLEQTK